MHGIGNDFVVIDCLANPWLDTAIGDFGAFARRVCRRAFSVGADGLLVLQFDNDCDCRMRIFNADGSEAGTCGNGIRCVARLLFERHVSRRELTIRTASGLRTVLVNTDGNGVFVSATVDMGAPVFDPSRVPVESDTPLVDSPLDIGGCAYRLTAVSMGNPHVARRRQHWVRLPPSGHGRHRCAHMGARSRGDARLRHGSLRCGCRCRGYSAA